MWLVVAAALLSALVAPALAAASWGNAADEEEGAQLLSADYGKLEQGDDSTVFATISADGRYVAFQTRARNFFADNDPDPPGQYRAGGIFRFDLQTRALQKVAAGDLFVEESNKFVRRGASNPSISGDGSFVAFATAESLVPADFNDNVDVYVRDMRVPIESPAAFDLVSARDGGDVPASYGPAAAPFPGSEPGSDVSRGVAISEDGQKVAFHTEAPSDLPAAASADVPAGQVFIRDRAKDTTTLVTATRDVGTGEMSEEPAGGAVGAALSGDGTTVAWTGDNAAAQTPFLSGENTDPSFIYYLWRRLVGDLKTAPTRRITGLADPEDSECGVSPPSFNRTSTGPCYGPLADREGGPANISGQLPAISSDGRTIAFLTGSGPRPIESTSPGLDLFVTSMAPGVTRKQATFELTRDTIGDPASSPPIGSVAISPDGRYLAITTVRTRFALPALSQLGEPRAVPGPRELYAIDLQERTLERVTHTYAGEDIDSDVLNGISLSRGGTQIAFTSFSGRLFFGDSNQRADAFLATRLPDPGGGQPAVGLGALGPAGTIETDRGGPQIGVRIKSKAAGEIVLTVSVPAAGGVKAVAKARAGAPRKLRTLATASGRARGAARSTVRLTLHPVRRYRGELRRRETIPGRVQIGYVASRGGRRASTSRQIVFRQEAVKKHDGSGRK